MLGNHNINNILASICVSRGLKIPYNLIKEALIKFSGVKRRFSILNKSNNNLVIDDYAHHPNEIKVTLETLNSITKKKLLLFSNLIGIRDFQTCLKTLLKVLKSLIVFLFFPFTLQVKKIGKIDSSYFYKATKKNIKKN